MTDLATVCIRRITNTDKKQWKGKRELGNNEKDFHHFMRNIHRGFTIWTRRGKKETYLKEKDAHSTASSSLPDIKAARDRWEKVCLNLQSREILLSFSIRVSNLLIMISSSSTHCWVNTRRKRGEKKTKERWEMWQNKDWMNSEGREKSRPEKGSSYESLITSLLES